MMAVFAAVAFTPELLRLARRHAVRMMPPAVVGVADVEDGPRDIGRANRDEGPAIAPRPVPVPLVVDVEVRPVAEEVVITVAAVDDEHPLLGDVHEWRRRLPIHDDRRRGGVADEDAEPHVAT